MLKFGRKLNFLLKKAVSEDKNLKRIKNFVKQNADFNADSIKSDTEATEGSAKKNSEKNPKNITTPKRTYGV